MKSTEGWYELGQQMTHFTLWFTSLSCDQCSFTFVWNSLEKNVYFEDFQNNMVFYWKALADVILYPDEIKHTNGSHYLSLPRFKFPLGTS